MDPEIAGDPGNNSFTSAFVASAIKPIVYSSSDSSSSLRPVGSSTSSASFQGELSLNPPNAGWPQATGASSHASATCPSPANNDDTDSASGGSTLTQWLPGTAARLMDHSATTETARHVGNLQPSSSLTFDAANAAEDSPRGIMPSSRASSYENALAALIRSDTVDGSPRDPRQQQGSLDLPPMPGSPASVSPWTPNYENSRQHASEGTSPPPPPPPYEDAGAYQTVTASSPSSPDNASPMPTNGLEGAISLANTVVIHRSGELLSI